MRVFRRTIYHSILLADHAFAGLVVRPITVRHHQEVGEAMRLLQGHLRVLDMVLRRDLGGEPSFFALTELFHVDAVSLRLRIAAGPLPANIQVRITSRIRDTETKEGTISRPPLNRVRSGVNQEWDNC